MEFKIESLEKEEDFDFTKPDDLLTYINALCANLKDKKLSKKVKKELLFKLRNEHGAIV